MTKCLLCQVEFDEGLAFYQLFTLSSARSLICAPCQSSFDTIAESHCPTCCKSGSVEICSDCVYWKNRGKSVSHTALFRYNQAMKDYFSRYKFQGDYLLRKVFMIDIRKALKGFKGYTLVPIPLSQERERERGFNQVTGLLEVAGLPYQDLLGKKEGQKQSERNRLERLQAENPFYVLDSGSLPDKILLIDDVYTTGATLQLATQLFYEKGVKKIKTFSLAR